MKPLAFLFCLAAFAVTGIGAPSHSPETLIRQINSLKQEQVEWREIEWRTCLLQGLKESREQRKPIVLWIFIDRPINDERC
jgi:hypothetical protein